MRRSDHHPWKGGGAPGGGGGRGAYAGIGRACFTAPPFEEARLRPALANHGYPAIPGHLAPPASLAWTGRGSELPAATGPGRNPGCSTVQASQLRDADKAYELLSGSINEGRPVLLATNPMKDMPTDGLVRGTYAGEGNRFNSGHAYTVEGISREADGSVSLTLRNPWGNNKFSGQGVDSPDPLVHVSLKTILDNGHLENVTIGPAIVQSRTAADGDRPQHAAR